MNKKLILIIFVMFFLFINISLSSAFFPKSHITWVINGFEQVDSSITRMCRPYLALTVDGESGSDSGVVHYSSKDAKVLGTYIFPHTYSGYLTGLEEAGASIEKRCLVIGNAIHIIQDSFSHNVGGVVEKYLKKFFGSNYFGHMTVERSFENKHMKLLEERNDYVISSGKLAYYDSIFLNSFFEETGGKKEYLDLMSEIAGVDMTNDFKIVRSGYQGENFYNTVYKDKVSLPIWAYGISIGLIIFGLIMILFHIFLGRTWWKWVSIGWWLIVMIIGGILIFSFINGTTWKLTTFIIEFPAKFGYLSVSDADVVEYDRLTQEATNQFLRTGQLLIDDASGLSYVDRNGVYRVGSLSNAERGFKYINYFFLIPLFIIINVLLILKSVGIRIFRRKK